VRAVASALWLALAAAASPAHAQTISGEELAARIARGDAPVVVDVRSEAEFRAGHVPGALHLPYQDAAARASEIPGPRSAPVVVYCERGPRAEKAQGALRAAGFADVRLLEGHMAGWRDAGRPLATPAAAPAAGVP